MAEQSRSDKIVRALKEAERAKRVTSWFAYAPGDWRGKRWVVETPGGVTRTYSTREVEAFLHGLYHDGVSTSRSAYLPPR